MQARSHKFAVAITTAVLGILYTSVPVGAQAMSLPWPNNDLFVIGDAQWQFDEFGLAYGWDVADNWSSDGYGYYPNEFRFDLQDGSTDGITGTSDDSYFLCGNPNTFRTETAVSQLQDGSVEIVCPETQVPGYADLSAQLTFMLFPENNSGYLVRQHVAVSNQSDYYVTIRGLELFNFPNIHTDYSGGQNTPGNNGWFEDSTGISAVQLSAGSNWYSQGMLDGSSVMLTNAWAKDGQGFNSSFVPAEGFDDPYAGASTRLRMTAPNLFPPQSQTNLLTYTNMVLPAGVDNQSAQVAQSVSLAQTALFDSFSGNLINGLPECTTYVGWGTTPGSCALAGSAQGGSSNQPCLAALAQTGFNAFISLLGALAAAAFGIWMMHQSRKGLRNSQHRSRRFLSPQGSRVK